jgi:glycosyltransferase involved in cell wall biosynthesis
MRILFIDFELPYLLKDSEFPVGGWAVQLRQILIALSAAGHDVGVLTWEGANAYVGEQSVCELVETYDPKKGIRKLRLLYYFLPSILRGVRAFKPDVIVQSCSGFNTGVMALMARLYGVPFVHRIACDTDADGRYGLYLKGREQIGFRFGLKRSQLVVCQNDYQLASIKEQFPEKPVRIVRNMILRDDSGSANAPPKRAYIAWLGVFRRQKNLPLLLRIARTLPEVNFRIGGMVPPKLDAETAEAIAGLKTLPNVEFAGYIRRERVPEFLKGATALLSTSDFEGFSNAFLEALQNGTPVVARKAIDPDSIIADNRLGLIAEDEAGLVEHVRAICRLDPAAYDQISQRCRAYVEAHHSQEKGVAALIGALSMVAAAS